MWSDKEKKWRWFDRQQEVYINWTYPWTKNPCLTYIVSQRLENSELEIATRIRDVSVDREQLSVSLVDVGEGGRVLQGHFGVVSLKQYEAG